MLDRHLRQYYTAARHNVRLRWTRIWLSDSSKSEKMWQCTQGAAAGGLAAGGCRTVPCRALPCCAVPWWALVVVAAGLEALR
ncbi:hypothetical protein E2C01_086864 [Portunus trituberculatus]|uniref:Uncharacterized protein n=1 Tax=Portunus trituberculatus TaxID=210409 RepID=A0A5B7JHI2_PORTR|nr:hypothetical protein [Portunus trituberculatus]